ATVRISESRTNSAGTYKTNIVYRGEPGGSDTTIVDGSVTTSLLGAYGQTLSTVTKDFKSGLVTAQAIYSNFDLKNRPQRVDYLDGTYTISTYNDCCGISTFQDRDGVTTSFTYDGLKRLVTSTRNSITTSNTYNANG